MRCEQEWRDRRRSSLPSMHCRSAGKGCCTTAPGCQCCRASRGMPPTRQGLRPLERGATQRRPLRRPCCRGMAPFKRRKKRRGVRISTRADGEWGTGDTRQEAPRGRCATPLTHDATEPPPHSTPSTTAPVTTPATTHPHAAFPHPSRASRARLQVWVRLKGGPVGVDVAGAVAHAVAVLTQDDGAGLACGARGVGVWVLRAPGEGRRHGSQTQGSAAAEWVPVLILRVWCGGAFKSQLASLRRRGGRPCCARQAGQRQRAAPAAVALRGAAGRLPPRRATVQAAGVPCRQSAAVPTRSATHTTTTCASTAPTTQPHPPGSSASFRIWCTRAYMGQMMSVAAVRLPPPS